MRVLCTTQPGNGHFHTIAPVAALRDAGHDVRPGQFDHSGDEGLPPWIETLPDLPVVHATLGTVMNRDTSLLAAILAALRTNR